MSKIKAVVLLSSMLLIGLIGRAQTSSDTSSNFILGKWVMEKYTITKNNEVIEKTSKGDQSSYSFLKSGYFTIYDSKNALISRGKWKYDAGKKRITLTGNTNVYGGKTEKAPDYYLEFIKIGEVNYLTHEMWDVETPPVVNYYKKKEGK